MEFRLLRSDEIDVRIAQIEKTWCTLLLYKNARTDMNILDETLGAMNWQRTHEVINGNLFCNIDIWDEDKKQWVRKQDVGVESYTEKEKGESSDSFKRAGTNVGIGRELYTSPTIFVTPRKDMAPTKKTDEEANEFFEKNGKYTTKTRFYVDYISYEGRNIQGLVIRDNKGNIRFEQLTDAEQKSMNEQFKKLQSLITANEDKDDNFDREELYKYFKVSSDAQLNLKQREKAIELLEKRLKKMMGIETYRDKCVEQSLLIDELYERIYNLEDELYRQEDTQESIIQRLLHSHITLGEMERIGMIFK